ncbi:hypothetical protein [Methylobacterium sp.]|uniref:hypothetical protein n=1 Tax=Methylobacterium sp. TaxID=409 RepID=UPI0025807581|nr:hypothetical protein [Methylobacterium sp.]
MDYWNRDRESHQRLEDWGSAPGSDDDGPVEDWGESEPVSTPITVPLENAPVR